MAVEGGSRAARGVACVAFGGVCWGFSGTCAQLLSGSYGVPVAWMMCMRMAIAAALYLVACLVLDRKRLLGLLRNPRDMAGILVFALLGVMLVQVCYLSCISYTNAGTATVFERLGLIIIMAFTCVTVRRKPHAREIAGLVLAIGGTVLIATKGNLGALSIPPEGLAWGFGSAVSLAFYTLLPSRLLAKWGSLSVVALAMTISAVLSNCIFQPWNMGVAVTGEILAATVAMGTIGTFFAYLVFLQGLKMAGPVLAGLVGCVEPVAATVISAVWLGTPTGPFDIAGCFMIVLMVLLVTERGDEADGAGAPSAGTDLGAPPNGMAAGGALAADASAGAGGALAADASAGAGKSPTAGKGEGTGAGLAASGEEPRPAG